MDSSKILHQEREGQMMCLKPHTGFGGWCWSHAIILSSVHGIMYATACELCKYIYCKLTHLLRYSLTFLHLSQLDRRAVLKGQCQVGKT